MDWSASHPRFRTLTLNKLEQVRKQALQETQLPVCIVNLEQGK